MIFDYAAVARRLERADLSVGEILYFLEHIPVNDAERLAGRLQTALYLFYQGRASQNEKHEEGPLEVKL